MIIVNISLIECYHSESHPLTPTFAPHTVGLSSHALSTNSPSATPSNSLPGGSGYGDGEGGEEGGAMMRFTASALPTLATSSSSSKLYKGK